MLERTGPTQFDPINRAYNAVFQPGRLSLGLVLPLDSYAVGAVPGMTDHIARVRYAEDLGFAAVWLRDVPFDVPSFGDVGQIYDPFVYLGLLAGQTQRIALGVASVILPLRHPAHVAKAAASADVLSDGRVLLGVASGDRPEEYPELAMDFPTRGDRFRDSVAYIRAMAEDRPRFGNSHGALDGQIDLLPKPAGGRLPLLITGGSRQAPDWVARHGDGWITYPRTVPEQARVIADYRDRIAGSGAADKPVMQSLYIDLLPDDDAPPRPIHLGFQSGIGFLRAYLHDLQTVGVNHVALNIRFNRAELEPTLDRLAECLLPDFSNRGP
ncbi:MAG: TIGR03571 family LLM class oxidoreductase [Pseudomonadota bacterium]